MPVIPALGRRRLAKLLTPGSVKRLSVHKQDGEQLIKVFIDLWPCAYIVTQTQSKIIIVKKTLSIVPSA